ncbi:hypothetical protein GGR39_003263 [Novosphingobium fluoreni]|uniref:TadE-like domain-containing protein n=1 Tax=Novosphingobium fluoreni TaxID=1391222 RepID=A0A7W6G0U9_9SPHN|nr:TadE/TadG family type IV pilus assembly protein [Novosphingobium fluoreni]KTR85051.1 hypothetical protein NS277_01550 [Novosphingobium barchaimii]MBB3941582.1 hypothetical protein [Novosphingobium fluoreni]
MAWRHDSHGNAGVEFALVAPVFLLLVLGGLDLYHTASVRAIAVGQLQKAARDTSLEDAAADVRQAAILSRLQNAVREIAPGATVNMVSKAYQNYGDVGSPEEFQDGNHNGKCDNGESFVDSNRNGTWDQDSAADGRGGAKDVVLLTATISYDHLPIAALLTSDRKVELVAKTLLRNQPNDQQADPPTGKCS